MISGWQRSFDATKQECVGEGINGVGKAAC
jgi:hypothetical protein